MSNAITPEQATTDRHIEQFLSQLNAAGGPPMEQLSPEAARQVLTDAQNAVAVDLSGVEITERTVNSGGHDLSLTVVRPAGAVGMLPVFMFFHGGGWVLGDFPTHQRLVRDLVVESGAAAVFVNYTPSPEAQYPVAIHQAYAATCWVAGHGAELNLDGGRLAVVGNSVGGNMAAVVAMMAKEQGAPHVRFQLLLWPVTDAAFDSGSYQSYPEGFFLSRNMMKWFWDNYTTDESKRVELHASPLRATPDQLAGLPPALIQVAEFDVLRDEGEAYGRKLNEAGVETTLVRYNGLIHDYGLLNPLSQVPAVKMALSQAAQALKTYLA
ncbi:alpha/beta hydrolase [Chimaeribacter arupi]|jgi:acetyl esterase/lipase|uniref:Alpha/beta hydrolase n=2 Tax=Chimaeribacter arupi TaxID=2060066 RepID=A0A2N5EPF7_9GAMM|nr:alpha/beta hydrolase [Chimaeribacter arupi]MDV5140631.1 alpha/beta hydrolase [Chimaeribacter arupi]PLR51179.1 alpha/beta hydrolase [Chimaeribacter arupi]PLR54500.1 alpha/beta hydrolase [Chimaeribacter arupi]